MSVLDPAATAQLVALVAARTGLEVGGSVGEALTALGEAIGGQFREALAAVGQEARLGEADRQRALVEALSTVLAEVNARRVVDAATGVTAEAVERGLASIAERLHVTTEHRVSVEAPAVSVAAPEVTVGSEALAGAVERLALALPAAFAAAPPAEVTAQPGEVTVRVEVDEERLGRAVGSEVAAAVREQAAALTALAEALNRPRRRTVTHRYDAEGRIASSTIVEA